MSPNHSKRVRLPGRGSYLGGNLVLVWDKSTQHKDTAMRELLAICESWPTLFRLSTYAPDLNPAESV